MVSCSNPFHIHSILPLYVVLNTRCDCNTFYIILQPIISRNGTDKGTYYKNHFPIQIRASAIILQIPSFILYALSCEHNFFAIKHFCQNKYTNYTIYNITHKSNHNIHWHNLRTKYTYH